MEIPLQAQVECTDGVCGRSVYVLIDPVAEKVTHLVVREDSSPYTEYIVPVETISATIVDTIQLRCSKAELEKMNPFVQTEFVEEKVPSGGFLAGNGMYGMGSYYYLPYVTSDGKAYEFYENSTDPSGRVGHASWYTCRGEGWLRWQSRRIRGQLEERPHYPFGDAGGTSMGKERCDHPPFSNG